MQSTTHRVTFLLCLTALVGACGELAGDSGSSGATGKADGSGFSGREEAGILWTANEASFELLDRSRRDGGVGLRSDAARSIISARSGADEAIDTDDDVPFSTTGDLLRLDHVGDAALQLLYGYARDQGMVLPSNYLCGWQDNHHHLDFDQRLRLRPSGDAEFPLQIFSRVEEEIDGLLFVNTSEYLCRTTDTTDARERFTCYSWAEVLIAEGDTTELGVQVTLDVPPGALNAAEDFRAEYFLQHRTGEDGEIEPVASSVFVELCEAGH